MVYSFESKPTATTLFSLTSDRFVMGAADLNCYQSFWINQGGRLDGKNFLLPGAGTIALTIGNNKLTGDLFATTMINEADSSETISISGHFDLDW